MSALALQTFSRWGVRQVFRLKGGQQCRAEGRGGAGTGTDAGSESSSVPAVTDEQRRAALRLPPKPARPAQPSDSGAPPEGGDDEDPGNLLTRIVIYLGGCV